MTEPAFTLFETPVGSCAIAWAEDALVGLNLPERDPSATKARLLRRFPDAMEAVPPAFVQTAIERILAMLDGAADDLADLVLDLTAVPDFHRRVYDIARTIPPGATMTYGEIAARLGDPSAARAVGQALGQNPFPIIVPCHRILGADGKLGGFSAPGGRDTKLRLLALEGAMIESRAARGTPLLFADLPLAAAPIRKFRASR